IIRASSTISAIGAKEPRSTDQWNMLMPVREYNKHIAKIPNCKMRRQWPALRGASMVLLLTLSLPLLLLHVVLALEPAAGGASSAAGSGGASPAGGGSGGATGGGVGGGPATTLIANLTEQGSPGVYNSTMA
ncbi:hypothetical protein KR026_002462, partial [Drosophila bipectinata]